MDLRRADTLNYIPDEELTAGGTARVFPLCTGVFCGNGTQVQDDELTITSTGATDDEDLTVGL